MREAYPKPGLAKKSAYLVFEELLPPGVGALGVTGVLGVLVLPLLLPEVPLPGVLLPPGVVVLLLLPEVLLPDLASFRQSSFAMPLSASHFEVGLEPVLLLGLELLPLAPVLPLVLPEVCAIATLAPNRAATAAQRTFIFMVELLSIWRGLEGLQRKRLASAVRARGFVL